MKKPLDFLNTVTSVFSSAETLWKIVTFLSIGGAGTISMFIASNEPYFKDVGLIGWISIGLICSLMLSIIIYLVKRAAFDNAYAEFIREVSKPLSRVNPIADTFKDQIVPIEELRLPGVNIHERKHFKNCTFVGPGAIAFMGGSFVRNNFFESGDVIPIPNNTKLSGIIGFLGCTIEDCKFYRVTLLMSKDQAEYMVKVTPGMTIAK